jgi:hypothetical protein
MVRTVAYASSEQHFGHGAFVIGLYVGLWIIASGWPVFLAAFLYHGWYRAATCMVVALLACCPDYEPKERIKAFMSAGCQSYFRHSSLVYEEGSMPVEDEPTILGVHPHGIFSMGWGLLFARAELRNVRFCFARVLVSSPFFKAFTQLIGRPAAADRSTFLKLMSKRLSLAIIPGGFEEATIQTTSADRVFLKARKGFVKYALQHGYSLTPVFAFGERETYANLQVLMPLRLWISGFGLPGIMPWGLLCCPVLPRDRRLHIVVGTPIQTPTARGTPNPTAKEVDEHHARYVQALTELYDRHKVEYYGAGGANQLEIW